MKTLTYHGSNNPLRELEERWKKPAIELWTTSSKNVARQYGKVITPVTIDASKYMEVKDSSDREKLYNSQNILEKAVKKALRAGYSGVIFRNAPDINGRWTYKQDVYLSFDPANVTIKASKPKTLQGLREAVTDNYLYHNTSALHFEGMIHYGAVGKTYRLNAGKNGYEWVTNVANGKYVEPKLFKGWVSFTRDKRYRAAPGAGDSEVRLIFDRDVLTQRHKLKPTRGIVARGANTDEVLTGAKARFEAEDLVMGPIPFRDGLVKVQITKEAYADAKKRYDLYIGFGKTALAKNDIISANNWMQQAKLKGRFLNFAKLEVTDWWK